MVIDKPSGTLTLAGTIRTDPQLDVHRGHRSTPGPRLVVFAATQAISGSHSLTDVIVQRRQLDLHASPPATTLTVAGSLTLTDGNINTGTVAAQGPISQASTFDGEHRHAARQRRRRPDADRGRRRLAAGSLPNVVIDKPSGTLTLAGTIRTTHNWTYTAGTLDPGTSLVVFAGGTVMSAGMRVLRRHGEWRDHHARIGDDGRSRPDGQRRHIHDVGRQPRLSIVTGRLTIAGTLRLNGSLSLGGGDLTLSGTFTAGTSTVTLGGSGRSGSRRSQPR